MSSRCPEWLCSAKRLVAELIDIKDLGRRYALFIQQRTDYATSMIDGRTVCELEPDGRSALEIVRLWEYLAGQLEKQERQRVFHQPTALGFGRRATL